MNCLFDDNPCVWQDYDKKIGKFGLCYYCYVDIYPDEKRRFKLCAKCNTPFLFKEDWQKICMNCWRASKK